MINAYHFNINGWRGHFVEMSDYVVGVSFPSHVTVIPFQSLFYCVLPPLTKDNLPLIPYFSSD